MDRLTGWDKGNPYVRACFEGDEGGCEHMDTIRCNRCERNLDAFRRLAQYEDIGLTPEEINALREAFEDEDVEDWAMEAVGCRKEAANANIERIRLDRENKELRSDNQRLKEALHRNLDTKTTRYERINAMSIEQVAAEIIRLGCHTEKYCKSDCDEAEDIDCMGGCRYDLECCVRWLNEEVAGDD